jgi:hypothetical protein
MALIAALMTGVGSGLYHVEEALARTGLQRPDMLAAGVDVPPAGTARQVDRLERTRLHRL